MQNLSYSSLTLENIAQIADISEASGIWQPARRELAETDGWQINILKERLQSDLLSLMNEATIWDRAIYPLLALAEQRPVVTWSQVALSAAFKNFTLDGYIDGVIGTSRAGHLVAPYLTVIEAKKGLEGKNPQPQTYGAMLAAAKLNWSTQKTEPQTIYGCYTISDNWTFLQGQAEAFEAEKPRLTIQTSREYVERAEAETILGILKAITHITGTSLAPTSKPFDKAN